MIDFFKGFKKNFNLKDVNCFFFHKNVYNLLHLRIRTLHYRHPSPKD